MQVSVEVLILLNYLQVTVRSVIDQIPEYVISPTNFTQLTSLNFTI